MKSRHDAALALACVFLTSCDQFFHGFLVRLQNDSGRTLTAASNIPGWEIGYINPIEKGGTDDVSNLQPLQWQNNRRNGDNRH